MKTYPFLFLLIIFFNSCNQRANLVSSEKLYTKKFSLPEGVRQPDAMQYRQFTDGKNILSLYFIGKKSIVNYDFKTGEIIDTFALDDSRTISGFYIHNKDSIFLLRSPNPTNASHDSSLVLTDSSGEIKKCYSFEEAPVFTNKRPFTQKSELADYAWASLGFDNLYFADNKLFFKLGNGSELFYNKLKERPFPIGGHINVKTDSFVAHSISQKHAGKNVGYPNDAFTRAHFTLNDENEIVYGFSYFDSVFIYSPETGKLKKRHTTFSKIPQKYDFSGKKLPLNRFFLPHYKNIVYNPYKKEYYRFATKRAGNKNSPVWIKNEFISFIAVYDKDFNKKGEGLYPYSSVYALPVPEGIAVTELKNSEIRFHVLKLTIHDGKLETEIEKYLSKIDKPKNPDITNYLKDLKLNDRDGGVILLPSLTSCKSCVEFGASFFMSNQKLCKEENIRLIVIGTSKLGRESFIANNDIDTSLTSVAVDSIPLYKKYIEDFFNPKLIILENGKVKYEHNYSPDELTKLPEDVNRYLVDKKNE